MKPKLRKVHFRSQGQDVTWCGIYITCSITHPSTYISKNVTCTPCRREIDAGRESLTIGARLRAKGHKT